KIEKADNRKKAITTFTNYQQAKNYLFKICGQYGMCQKLTGLHPSKGACFAQSINECNGACIGNENPEEYNSRITDFIKAATFYEKDLLIIDKRTQIDTKSVIYIENGNLIGIATIELNYQITNRDILRALLTPISNNRDAHHIMQKAARQNKLLKIKYLSQILI